MKAISCWMVAAVLVCASNAWAADIERVAVGPAESAGKLPGNTGQLDEKGPLAPTAIGGAIGACCNEADWSCTDDVLEGDCPFVWTEAGSCAVDCVEPPTGACCVDNTCTDDVEEPACTGYFFFAETCAEVTCVQVNDTCETALAVECGTTFGGSNLGTTNDYDTGCTTWGSHGPDIVYALEGEGEVAITMTPDGFDAVLFVVTDCSDVDTCVAAGDDPEELTFTMSAGVTYYIVADTYSSSSSGGTFTLEISPCGVEPTGACCNEADWSCTDDMLEADCAYTWSEGAACGEGYFCRPACTNNVDCAWDYNDACTWNHCDLDTGYCDPPIPRMYGDVCGATFDAPPNGAVNITDVLCVIGAMGVGNLHECPNSDIAVATAGQCPGSNGVVGLTDILKVLDAYGAPAPGARFMCHCPDNPY